MFQEPKMGRGKQIAFYLPLTKKPYIEVCEIKMVMNLFESSSNYQENFVVPCL